MGKHSNKRRRPSKPGKMHAQEVDSYMDKEMDDEIDVFHKQQEMILLDVNEDAGDSDDDLDEPVFDLEGYQNGISFNGREEEEEEEEDDDNENDRKFDDVDDKGFAAKIARQAKYLKEKFGAGEDEMSDDDEQDEERKSVWGRKKNLYYSADNVDYELQSSDEDLPMEEEAEVLKIQREKAKTLQLEDFGLEASNEEESDFDGTKKTFQELSKGRGPKESGADIVDDVTINGYEEIKTDLNALSKAEQMDVVYSSAPELVSLLSELNTAVNQLRQVNPLACKVITKGKVQDRGMDYLDVNRILLLTYCQAISFYLLLKSEGHSVRDHPVIARLVEIKNLWEKMKSMRLKFLVQSGEVGIHIDESINLPNGENASLESEPSLADLPAKPLTGSEMAGLLKDGSKDSNKKSLTKKIQDSQRDKQSIEMMKIRENLEAKLKQKGIYCLIREKANKARDVLAKPTNRNHLTTTNDFDDEVRHSKQHGSDNIHQSANKLTQTVFKKAKGSKVISGDGDLPKRDDIAERRRKHELRVLSRAGVIPTDDGDKGFDEPGMNNVGTDLEEGVKESESEDEFYQKVKKQRTERLTAKAERYSRALGTPTEEPEVDGKRHITRQIEKNRGLTRTRKKLTKNPRKKYKIKHQKAVIRRKGQVRDIRKPSGPYGGEATGINTSVSRSIRFKS